MRSLDWNSPVRSDQPNDEMDQSCQVRMRFHMIMKTCAFFRATERHNPAVWMNCIVLVDLDQRMSALAQTLHSLARANLQFGFRRRDTQGILAGIEGSRCVRFAG